MKTDHRNGNGIWKRRKKERWFLSDVISDIPKDGNALPDHPCVFFDMPNGPEDPCLFQGAQPDLEGGSVRPVGREP